MIALSMTLLTFLGTTRPLALHLDGQPLTASFSSVGFPDLAPDADEFGAQLST